MGNISDQIEYVPEEPNYDKLQGKERNLINELLDLPLKDIIERWDKSQSHGDDGKVLNDDYWMIPIALRNIFNLPKTQDINESIKSIKEAIDALDAKLRNHRHNLNETYSAKPEF